MSQFLTSARRLFTAAFAFTRRTAPRDRPYSHASLPRCRWEGLATVEPYEYAWLAFDNDIRNPRRSALGSVRSDSFVAIEQRTGGCGLMVRLEHADARGAGPGVGWWTSSSALAQRRRSSASRRRSIDGKFAPQ